MRTLVSYLIFVLVSTACTYPVAWIATRIRTSLYIGGYYSTDPVQLRYLWLFFTLLLLAGGWIMLVPPRSGNIGS
jgi:hypothetical protein